MDEKKKETTAPFPSEGTDGEQSSTNFGDAIIADEEREINADSELLAREERRRNMERMNNPNYLHTLTVTALLDKVYRVNPPLIHNFLNAGTYLLVGAPKTGKSFLMAQVGYHVSAGLPLWGYEVKKRTVLYLALEDGYDRLQKRLVRMFGTTGADNYHLATLAGQLGISLEGQLTDFIREHPETGLVIIDTLQKIRNASGENYSYAKDYESVAAMKKISDEYGICLILVHHTRKQSSEDPFDTISGTNGLLGAADGALVLKKDKRIDTQITVDITGRDQQDQVLYLEKDKERLIWQLVRVETEVCKEPTDPVLEAIAQMLTPESTEWTGTASELAECMGFPDMKPNALTRHLNVNVNRLLEEYGIHYESSRSNDRRIVKLSRKEFRKA